MMVEDNHGLVKCCNGHDICFGVCGTTFSYCESRFSKCMRDLCKDAAEPAQCNKEAQGFSGMTRLHGGGFHTTRDRSRTRQHLSAARSLGGSSR